MVSLSQNLLCSRCACKQSHPKKFHPATATLEVWPAASGSRSAAWGACVGACSTPMGAPRTKGWPWARPADCSEALALARRLRCRRHAGGQPAARLSCAAWSGVVHSEAPGTAAGAVTLAMRAQAIARTLAAVSAASCASFESGFRVAARLHGTAHASRTFSRSVAHAPACITLHKLSWKRTFCTAL